MGMSYRTIAVGTDGSQTAMIAEGVALKLAGTSGGDVLFVSAHLPDGEGERSQQAVESARARADAAGVKADTALIEAEPADGIVELADRHDAELIVVGDVGMGESRRFRLGGVPDRVSHNMPCDLLIVRTSKADRAKPPGEYSSVLIATDGSPTADRAARVGAEFAHLMGAGVTLVHVGDESLGTIILHDTAERLGDRELPIRTLGGDPGEAIVELAASEGHDLVVVGNKGMTGALRFLLGVVPDKVSHAAPCDVLIVNTVGRSVEDLELGEGAIVEVDGKKVAAYRDASGELVRLSPKCKHMGCTVGWNHRAKTWDCPCHGSRYDSHGGVVNGPTRHPLDPVDAPKAQ
jgi:nucleotide-binding universal stress UspA family protein/nitrite reductase/ring-hydroxylating ferredoxin subunit